MGLEDEAPAKVLQQNEAQFRRAVSDVQGIHLEWGSD